MAACRYSPVGVRSVGPVRGTQYGGGDYVAHANDEIIVMAMIETAEELWRRSAPPRFGRGLYRAGGFVAGSGPGMRADNPDPLHMETCRSATPPSQRHQGGDALRRR